MAHLICYTLCMIRYEISFSGVFEYRSQTGWKNGDKVAVQGRITHCEESVRYNQPEILASAAWVAFQNRHNQLGYYPTLQGFTFKVESVNNP
jgi:hypothetical protein